MLVAGVPARVRAVLETTSEPAQGEALSQMRSGTGTSEFSKTSGHKAGRVVLRSVTAHFPRRAISVAPASYYASEIWNLPDLSQVHSASIDTAGTLALGGLQRHMGRGPALVSPGCTDVSLAFQTQEVLA